MIFCRTRAIPAVRTPPRNHGSRPRCARARSKWSLTIVMEDKCAWLRLAAYTRGKGPCVGCECTFGIRRGRCRRTRCGSEQDASGSPRWRRWRRLRVRACANSSSTHSCGVLRSAGETSSFGGRTASIPRRLSISHCHILYSTHNVTYTWYILILL